MIRDCGESDHCGVQMTWSTFIMNIRYGHDRGLWNLLPPSHLQPFPLTTNYLHLQPSTTLSIADCEETLVSSISTLSDSISFQGSDHCDVPMTWSTFNEYSIHIAIFQ